MLAHLFISHDGRPATRGQRIALGVLLSVFMVGVLFATGFFYWEAYQDGRRVAAPCRITSSRVLVDTSQRLYRDRPYKFEVHYRFVLGGTERPGHGYEHRDFETDDAAEA